jgi:hypothetical protein
MLMKNSTKLTSAVQVKDHHSQRAPLFFKDFLDHLSNLRMDKFDGRLKMIEGGVNTDKQHVNEQQSVRLSLSYHKLCRYVFADDSMREA